MHWRLRTARPMRFSHASSRVLHAELAPVAAAVALDVVRDFLLSALRLLAGSICPCSNTVQPPPATTSHNQPQRQLYPPDQHTIIATATSHHNRKWPPAQQQHGCHSARRRPPTGMQATSKQSAQGGSHKPRHTYCLLNLLLLQPLWLWLLSGTFSPSPTTARWKHLPCITTEHTTCK